MATRLPPPGKNADRSLLQRIPRRNLARALFLVLALLAIVAIKRGSGGFFGNLMETLSPTPPAGPTRDGGPPLRSIEVKIPSSPDADR
jgi:hypothetical protein